MDRISVLTSIALLGINLLPGEPALYPSSVTPTVQIHNGSFQPDRILRVTSRSYLTDCLTKPSVLINDSSPGPLLRFREGDKVWIRVYNDMEEANVTIHWHGLTQRTSPFSDGTPSASQWPIPPLHFFDYEFQLFPGDAGTYFYHSHVGFGAITAFGGLIIDAANGTTLPYEYDDERLLLISDAFHLNDSYIVQGLLQNPFRWSGETDNIQVNGKSRWVNATRDQAGTNCSMEVITIKPDQIYRFRLVGATSLSFVFLQIQSHSELFVIEADGLYTSPVQVDHIEINSGQRFSVLLRARSRSQILADRAKGIFKYWIQMETRARSVLTRAFAILTYDLADATYPNQQIDNFAYPPAPPLVLPNETFAEGWIQYLLEPIDIQNVSGIPTLKDVTRRVIIDIQQVFTGSVTWRQNNNPWFEDTPKEPYLVSLYKNETKYFPNYTRAIENGGFDNLTKTYPAKVGEVLEIVWQSLGSTGPGSSGGVETHPFHAHGDHYWDLGSGYGVYDPVATEAKNQGRVLLKRDTTNIYRTPMPTSLGANATYSWRAWRIKVTNPGVWMIHCHTLQHMIMGMQTVWVFGEFGDLTPLPQDFVDGYLTYGGSANGNATFAPRVLHYWHD